MAINDLNIVTMAPASNVAIAISELEYEDIIELIREVDGLVADSVFSLMLVNLGHELDAEQRQW